jgi:hypothetical protein
MVRPSSVPDAAAVECAPLGMSNGGKDAMVRVALIVSLVVACVMAAGPAAIVAEAKPSCRAGYKLQRKRGVYRCVRQPTKPRPPADAVVPSSIVLTVAKLENGGFGATGYMEFPKLVTGTAYGEWVLSNGVARERAPFRLSSITNTDYTPFTIGYPIEVHISGRTVSATLVIGRVRSNSITVKQ